MKHEKADSKHDVTQNRQKYNGGVVCLWNDKTIFFNVDMRMASVSDKWKNTVIEPLDKGSKIVYKTTGFSLFSMPGKIFHRIGLET